ncbi:MAG: hypothetical protein ACFFFB_01325 [Candidatus Heimdallarchaeota archaeon]
MENKITILISVLSGIILNVVLGFIPNPIGSLLGSQQWGYPIYWLSQVIYPGAPIEISWLTFLFDVIVWTLSFFLILKLTDFLIKKYRK